MTRFTHCTLISVLCLLSACNKAPNKVETEKTPPSPLGDLKSCQQYSGLPEGWLKQPQAGMQYIQGGTFHIGNNQSYPEEKALYQRERKVSDFWMDRTEVSQAQFQSFVQATGYVTEAERQGEAAVFQQPQRPVAELAWWSLVKGANWKQPWGPHSSQKTQPNEPVRMITLKDAIAYADWLGRELPTEEQWEYAAKANIEADTAPNSAHVNANVWQGEFPYHNEKQDHFAEVSPVGCFTANHFGLYDMIGNVWEYTNSPFTGTHDDHMGVQQISNHHAFTQYTIKGGSFLCASNYCMRYRASARHPQESNLAISHVGFRTIQKVTTK